jgi:hypothetical protein
MSKIFYTARVVDNEDPYLLGRIRAFPISDEDVQKVLEEAGLSNVMGPSVYDPGIRDISDIYKFTDNDPFVFQSLLPPYFNVIPKKDELVWVTYANPSDRDTRKEQWYTTATKSSPFNIGFDYYEDAKVNTAQGFNIKPPTQYKSSSANGITQNENYTKEYSKPVKGIFAEPGHNAIYGQGSTDVILKQSEVLIRAGKVVNMTPNLENPANDKRAFFQMSYYNKMSTLGEPESYASSKINEDPIKKLIEYHIDTLDVSPDIDSFTGQVYIYDIPPSANLKNNEFTATTPIPPGVQQPFWSYQFNAQPFESVVNIINSVINGLNEGKIEISATTTLSASTKTFDEGIIFPFYYRPDSFLRDVLYKSPSFGQGDSAAFIKFYNASRLVSQIRFIRALTDFNGEGLVSRKNKFGISKTKIKKVDSKRTNIYEKNSVSVLGSNKILLLSHDSTIPALSKVNLDSSTIYGLTQDQIYENLLPNTNGLVRGEKLKELLGIIVRFLTTHAHPYHQLPPTPISSGGVSVEDLEIEFQNYDSKVLNENIRIN